uniref:Secreted protein n=1 Tax=Arundo donax TaxID=35708 RepID=A0A0A9BPH6_ARUDO
MIRRMLLIHNMHASLRLKLWLSLQMCLEGLIPHGVLEGSFSWCSSVCSVQHKQTHSCKFKNNLQVFFSFATKSQQYRKQYNVQSVNVFFLLLH